MVVMAAVFVAEVFWVPFACCLAAFWSAFDGCAAGCAFVRVVRLRVVCCLAGLWSAFACCLAAFWSALACCGVGAAAGAGCCAGSCFLAWPGGVWTCPGAV